MAGAEHLVGREGRSPFVEIQIARHQRGNPLIALGDEIVEIFIVWRAQGFEAKIVDDEQRGFGQALQAPLELANGLGVAQAGEQLALGGEQHIVSEADGAMADGLGQMAFAGAARSRDILPGISSRK